MESNHLEPDHRSSKWTKGCAGYVCECCAKDQCACVTWSLEKKMQGQHTASLCTSTVVGSRPILVGVPIWLHSASSASGRLGPPASGWLGAPYRTAFSLAVVVCCPFRLSKSRSQTGVRLRAGSSLRIAAAVLAQNTVRCSQKMGHA